MIGPTYVPTIIVLFISKCGPTLGISIITYLYGMFGVVLNTLEKYWKDTTRGLQLKPFVVWFPFNLTSFFGQKFKKNLNSLEFKIFTQSFHPKLKLWSKSLGRNSALSCRSHYSKTKLFLKYSNRIRYHAKKSKNFWMRMESNRVHTLCTTTILTNRPHMFVHMYKKQQQRL